MAEIPKSIEIPFPLHQQIKVLSAQRSKPMKEVIIDLLVDALNRVE